jgi:hypothetical protein
MSTNRESAGPDIRRTCEARGCSTNLGARRRKFCSNACADRERKRRCRNTAATDRELTITVSAAVSYYDLLDDVDPAIRAFFGLA